MTDQAILFPKLSLVKILFCLSNQRKILIFKGMLADKMLLNSIFITPQNLTKDRGNELKTCHVLTTSTKI